MSDTMSSVSSASSMPSLGGVLRSAKRDQTSFSCSKWLVPVLIVTGVVLLFYLSVNYWKKCNYGNNNSNNNSNSNNSNGVMLVSRMTNNTGNNGNNSNTGGVMDVTGQQLANAMNEKPVVVAFLADGCGWCTKLKPEYHKAASKSKHPLHTLYAHRDGAMDILKMFQIAGFPTIYIIHKGKVLDEYKGPRTEDAIAQWVNSKLG
jgi:thiol-disulfide isomerase/thioredoxin